MEGKLEWGFYSQHTVMCVLSDGWGVKLKEWLQKHFMLTSFKELTVGCEWGYVHI